MLHIDAHGPDHGLSVEIDLSRHEVTIRQWGECCEADENGSYSPHIYSATIPLARLISGPHLNHGGHIDSRSMHGRIATLAMNWLAHWGGEEEWLDDNERPCHHFGSWWGSQNSARRHDLTCSACGAAPTDHP